LTSLIVVGSWITGALLAAAPPKNAARRADHGARPVSVPIQIFGGFLVVAQGQIGSNLRHQNFILDTGTSPSILNARVARQLGLSLVPARLAAIGRESEIRAARVPEIALGPLRTASADVLVTDLSGVEQNWKMPIAGILGLDILGQTSFRIDYENHVLEFGDISPEGIAVNVSPDGHLPIAEVNINGKPLRLLVDTGSDRLVFFGNKNAQRLGASAGSELIAGESVSGGVAVRGISSLEVEWSGERFQQRAVVVSDRQEPLFDGLLSVRSLGFRSIAMDAASQTVYLRK
jgi:predicted aspartyl protease